MDSIPLSASDILSIDGSRVPDSSSSQKSFRVAYIVLSKESLSNLEWADYDTDVYDFSLEAPDGYESSRNFWEATGGLATVKMDELKNGIAGSPQLDRDHDTVLDSSDNCPNVPNSNQQDSDGNGRGDA